MSLRGGSVVSAIGGEEAVHGCRRGSVAPSLLGSLLRASFHTSAVNKVRLCDIIIAHSTRGGRVLSPTRFGRPVMGTTPIMLAFYTSFHHFYGCYRREGTIPKCNGLVSFLGTTVSALLITRAFYALTRRTKLNVYCLNAAACGPRVVVSTLRLPRLIFPVAAIAIKCPTRSPGRMSHLPVRNVVRRRDCRSCATRSVGQLCTCGRSLPRGGLFVRRGRGRALTRMFASIHCAGGSGRFVSRGLLGMLHQRNFVSWVAVGNRQWVKTDSKQ